MLPELKKPPAFVNEKGIKFWLDETLTKYAKEPGQVGISLLSHKVYIAEMPDGTRTRLMTDGRDWICDSPRLEDIACRIDWEKMKIISPEKNQHREKIPSRLGKNQLGHFLS